MNSDTEPHAPLADAGPRHDRRNLAAALAGLFALVIGAVVLALGLSSASSASGDLGHAQKRLSSQQDATRRALQCEHDLRGGLPKVILSAQALLNTSAQLAGQDQQAAQAARDGQVAGSQARIDDYNGSVTRANASADAANGLISTANQQSPAFRSEYQALLTACPV